MFISFLCLSVFVSSFDLGIICVTWLEKSKFVFEHRTWIRNECYFFFLSLFGIVHFSPFSVTPLSEQKKEEKKNFCTRIEEKFAKSLRFEFLFLFFFFSFYRQFPFLFVVVSLSERGIKINKKNFHENRISPSLFSFNANVCIHHCSIVFEFILFMHFFFSVSRSNHCSGCDSVGINNFATKSMV